MTAIPPVAFSFNPVAGGSLTGYTYPFGVQLSAYAITITFASDIAPLQAAGVYNSSSLSLENGQSSALQLDAAGNLKVNVIAGGGGGSGSNASVSTTGAAAPASATAVGYKNPAGNLVIPGITASGGVQVDGSGVTQPISAAALPLPAGAATSANQPSLVATSAGNASRFVISDPASGVGALVQAFHNSDNQALGSTVYGIMTGGVDQLVNGAGNLDRKRGVSGDAMAVTGLAAEVPMIYNGASYDRLRSVSGDAAASTGIVQEAVALWNGTNYDRWYGDKNNGAWVNVKALPLAAGAATAAAQASILAATQASPVGATNFATSQASISSNSSASPVVAARTGAQGAGRVYATLYNQGPSAVYYGPSGVTASTGVLLPVGASSPPIPTTASISAILPPGVSTASTVSALEIY